MLPESKKNSIAITSPKLLPFRCNFCDHTSGWLMADLGVQPLANNYLRNHDDIPKERAYPLTARVCTHCQLCQVDRIVEPTDIFSHYAYFSSVSSSWVEHARRYATDMINRFGLTKKSLVMEVASNDGYLLQHFVAVGIPVLGVEPARNIAAHANSKGIHTISEFMSKKSASALIKEGFSADLIAANNVLAHVPDLNDFIAGLRVLLKPSGVLTVEFHHLLQLLKHGQFDTIYHEHFSYLSLHVVKHMFEKHGLIVFDVEELSSHGGSLRVYAYPSDGTKYPITSHVARILDLEKNARLEEEATYIHFHDKVSSVREHLRAFLAKASADKKSVIAYGAAAKGNTLLNYCGITTNDISHVVDKNPHKQSQLLPGSHIPIIAPEHMHELRPDFVLILPWNIQREIMAEHDYIREWGGQFVIPIPYTHILS